MQIFKELKDFISDLSKESVSKNRQKKLQPLVDFIREKMNQNEEIRLNFICTHNSRRSHLSQVWAQSMACYFQLENIECYSGGTEATAVFPEVVETLIDSGFRVKKLSEENNPRYSIKFAENEAPVIAFSKKWSHDLNPKSAFCAILTCSQADEECPFISGAEKRISLPYEDPKIFDNTPQRTEKYKERSMQIATEMFYLFKNVKFSNTHI